MKDFKELFNELIEEYPGDESIKWAQQRLKERGLQHKDSKLINNGPCLLCHTSIAYSICDLHRRHKDEWLLTLRAKIHSPLQLKHDFRKGKTRIQIIRAGGPPLELQSISGYFCNSCLDRIQSIADLEEQRKKLTRKAMPYSDFLQTDYWKTVRLKALRRAGYSCQLCKSSKALHVHHKTYENRGDELNHMDDLIVLCASCHETSHKHEKKERIKPVASIGMPSAISQELSA